MQLIKDIVKFKNKVNNEKMIKINNEKRIHASFRRLKYELLKTLGVFYMIEKIPGIKIREPFKPMHNRSKKRN